LFPWPLRFPLAMSAIHVFFSSEPSIFYIPRPFSSQPSILYIAIPQQAADLENRNYSRCFIPSNHASINTSPSSQSACGGACVTCDFGLWRGEARRRHVTLAAEAWSDFSGVAAVACRPRSPADQMNSRSAGTWSSSLVHDQSSADQMIFPRSSRSNDL
jgi:hypothetical protein